MKFLTCEYCGNRIAFQAGSDLPEECPACLSKLIIPADIPNDESSFIELIHQGSGKKIIIKGKSVIGREKGGKEFLGSIPHISRSHCLIEPVGSFYAVTDLGSVNGTFLGTLKIDCKKNPSQELKNNDLLYLGKEAFIVAYKTGDDDSGINIEAEFTEDPLKHKKIETEIKEPAVFECHGCHRYSSDIKEFTCPVCNTYND